MILSMVDPTAAFGLDSLEAYRFGPRFFAYPSTSILDGPGAIWTLSPHSRAVTNVRHTGDLFRGDIRFYHPDLATPGREIVLSPLGMGEAYNRVLWRGRPWRMPGTWRGDLSLLPPNIVGSASSSTGTLDGASGAGLIALDPVRSFDDGPATALSYRTGFYGFEPVGFVHHRRVAASNYLRIGGFIPSSSGRFPHSAQHGRTLWSEIVNRLGSDGEVSLAFQSVRQGVEIPGTPVERQMTRGDVDLAISHTPETGSKWSFGLYRAETRLRELPVNEYGRETGGVVRWSRGDFGMMARLTRSDGTLDGGIGYRVDDGEASLQWNTRRPWAEMMVQAGATGALPDRILPAGGVTLIVPGI
ncbi:MAG: hypothetical protein FJY67_07760, partial [Calditrichaeota bacterium]|nr:hypothetical protein [Calditrichota bacterium]